MPRKPSVEKTATAVKPATPTPIAATSAPVEKQLYYRIRKISGYLAEILEVEIDETQVIPKVVSKQDSWQYLTDKVTQLCYPSTDEIARRKRDKARAAAKATESKE